MIIREINESKIYFHLNTDVRVIFTDSVISKDAVRNEKERSTIVLTV